MTFAVMMAEITRRLAAGETFCVVTVVRARAATAAKAGAKAIIAQDGSITGYIGGGCARAAAVNAAVQALADGRTRLIRILPKDEVANEADEDGVSLHKSSCPSRGTLDLFIEPVRPPPLVVVVGGSPVASALASLAAALHYRVLAAGAEEDSAKFGDTVQFRKEFDFVNETVVTQDDFVVVATQGQNDMQALRTALATTAKYVGMISSRAKAANLRSRLRTDNVSEQSIARLKAPAGLDIQAIDPEEIALSVMAEIVLHRRRDNCPETVEVTVE